MAGTEFTIKIENLARLKDAFERYPEISEPLLQKGLLGTSALLAKYTRKQDPVPYRTGNLLQSFRQDSGRLYTRWYPTAKYAMFVHDGVVAHVINAKGGGLASKDGQFFGKKVRHPGFRGQPFMPQILARAQPDIDNLFGDVLDKVVKAIAS